MFYLRSQAGNNLFCSTLKTPPVGLGAQGMDAAAINATVPFEPDYLSNLIEISGRIAVTPKSFPVATWARLWPWPGVILAF